MEKNREAQFFNIEIKDSISKGMSLTIHSGGKKSKTNRTIYKNKVKFTGEGSQNSTTYEIFSDTMNYGSRANLVSESTNENQPPTSGGGDGGNGMEKRLDRLELKTEQIQTTVSEATTKLAVIEEAQKNMLCKSDFLEYKNEIIQAISNLPQEDNIKQIISTSFTDKKLATENYVETAVVKNTNTQIKWLIATALTTCGAIIGIIKFFFQ